MKEYQVLVVSDTNNFDFIYVGARIKKLFFFFHDSHFDYLKSLPAFFDCDKFRFICLLPYHHNLAHKCLKICKLCNQKGWKEQREKNKEFICSKCKVLCSDKTCLLNNQAKDHFICVMVDCAVAVPMDHSVTIKCFILSHSERESRIKRGNQRNSDGKQIEL